MVEIQDVIVPTFAPSKPVLLFIFRVLQDHKIAFQLFTIR